MKKFAICYLLIALSACGGRIKNEHGSEHLVKMETEPTECAFMYKIETEASVYSADDARVFLENQIAARSMPVNAYFITSQRTRPNEGVIFGPERTFIIQARAYNCPTFPIVKN